MISPALLASTIALAGLLALGVLWSLHVVLAKLIDARSLQDVLSVMILYIGVQAVLMLLAFCVLKRHPPRIRGAGGFFLISAIFGYILPVHLDLIVAPRLPLSHLSLIVGSGSMMALLIGWIMRLENPNRWRLLGVSIGFMAVLVLFGNPFAQDFQLSFWYPIALLLPLSYAFGDCYIDKFWPKQYGTFEVAAGDSLMAAMLLLIIVLVYVLGSGLSLSESLTVMREVVLKKPLALLGLMITTLVSVVLFYVMLNRHGAVFVSAAIYPALFSGVLFGVVLFDEPLAVRFLLALVLLVIGLGIIRWSDGGDQGRER